MTIKAISSFFKINQIESHSKSETPEKTSLIMRIKNIFNSFLLKLTAKKPPQIMLSPAEKRAISIEKYRQDRLKETYENLPRAKQTIYEAYFESNK